MISGLVKDGYATVGVAFRFFNRSDLSIEFVIDTGFTDYLCLPSEAVALLGLPLRYAMPVNLADNSEVTLAVHEATILWHGEERDVRVLATGRRPLLGVALLEEHELVVQFAEGGLVTIEKL